ncbi:MAG: glycosyltransferase family 2 protein [Actinomycetota bacterium]
MTRTSTLDVSIVIPCLNEETTIVACVEHALAAIVGAGVRGEVLVVDNNSTDRSAELARAAGARVIHETRRGYGSAYLAGLAAAEGRAILMGDADLTYDFGELGRFLNLMDSTNADMVMGNRMQGQMEQGAMPWLHKWIGNPALTGLLNMFFRTGVKDAHCGLRMVRTSALERMNLCTPGMEFASEMVIKAARAGLKIIETPIEYKAHPELRESKLNTWRDGFRHLRYMLASAPGAWYWVPALTLAALGAVSLLGVTSKLGGGIGGGLLLAAGGLVAQIGAWLHAYGMLVIERRPAWANATKTIVRAGFPLIAVAIVCTISAFNSHVSARIGSSISAAAFLVATTLAGIITVQRRRRAADQV